MEAGLRRAATVRQERRGPVLLLWLDHPPVNALSAALRGALAAALAAAADDVAVEAVVIAADGPQFSAGADLTEMGCGDAAKLHPGALVAPEFTPDLGALCQQIEGFAKPVVMALHAAALGGGLELALAADLRVALVSARLGLPEVRLGLLPGAGGTQRLPRLIGPVEALRLMQGGDAVTAAEALALGLVDRVVEGEVVAAAVAAALEAMGGDGRRDGRRTGQRDGRRMAAVADPTAYQAALAQARASGQMYEPGYLPAVARIADCVEAALLLPAAQGLAFERAAFADLLASPEALGLRHAFFTGRRAAYPPKPVASVAPQRLGSVAVWGAEGQAADLGRQALCAGLRVTMIEPDRAVLVAALERIAGWQEAEVAAGRLTAAARDADWARLVPALVPEGLVGADLVLAMADAGPVPAIAAGVPQVLVGGSHVGASEGGPSEGGIDVGIGLQPGQAAGDLAELSVWPDAPVPLQALGLAFARRMGWRVVFAAGAGGIERRLRAALAAAIAQQQGGVAQQGGGVADDVIRAALAAFGIGGGLRGPLPAMPEGGGAVLASCLAAVANEGARMVSQGVALRPGDVDAVAVMSGFYPRWQGGPMFWADQRGALVLRAELQRRAQGAPQLFTPAPVFDWLVAEGRSFAALNRG